MLTYWRTLRWRQLARQSSLSRSWNTLPMLSITVFWKELMEDLPPETKDRGQANRAGVDTGQGNHAEVDAGQASHAEVDAGQANHAKVDTGHRKHFGHEVATNWESFGWAIMRVMFRKGPATWWASTKLHTYFNIFRYLNWCIIHKILFRWGKLKLKLLTHQQLRTYEHKLNLPVCFSLQ